MVSSDFIWSDGCCHAAVHHHVTCAAVMLVSDTWTWCDANRTRHARCCVLVGSSCDVVGGTVLLLHRYCITSQQRAPNRPRCSAGRVSILENNTSLSLPLLTAHHHSLLLHTTSTDGTVPIL